MLHELAGRQVGRGARAALMAEYAGGPMSLADACLVRMTELDGSRAVMTLDGGFVVYRRHGREVIPVMMPPE